MRMRHPTGAGGRRGTAFRAPLEGIRPGDETVDRDAALARANGAVALDLAAEAGGTRLVRLAQRSPARALFPRCAGRERVAVLLNTAGGVCSGDRMAVGVRLGRGARATLVGQAAERVYRALDRPASLQTSLHVAAGGRLHWAPQETILFDGASLERRTELHLEGDARILAAETLVFGRRAMGETLRSLHLHDRWLLRRDGHLLFADAFRVSGAGVEALGSPVGLDGAEALCTLVFAGGDADAIRDAARPLLEAPGLRGGATNVRGVALVRLLGGSAGVRRVLTQLLESLREMGLGFDAALPPVWSS